MPVYKEENQSALTTRTAHGNYPVSLLLMFAVYCSLLTIFYGCASAKGPVSLMPKPVSSPEYTISAQTLSFNNNALKISIQHLKPAEAKKILTAKDVNNPIAEILGTDQYIIFLMDIENLSKAKILYNPTLTTLFDNNMGLRKPLDYTDVYYLIRNAEDAELLLRRLKDTFYDLTVTLNPGQRTSRLLIFASIEDGATAVTIAMKEVYIGTSSISVSFEFEMKETAEKS